MFILFWYRLWKDTKGIIRSRKSNTQYGQKEKNNMTSSDLQNTTQKQTELHKTTITVGESQVLRNGKHFCFTSDTRRVLVKALEP
jgi:hypothetical protein